MCFYSGAEYVLSCVAVPRVDCFEEKLLLFHFQEKSSKFCT